MNNNKCSCGRPKYPDATSCDSCYKESRAWDAYSRDDPNYCSCGNGKYPDASCCDVCWSRNSAYDDGRG